MKFSLEPILKLAQPVLRLIKREPEARDAFGGDDLFDGDSKPSSMGPKIALAASGAMLLGLLGFVGTLVMSGDDAEPTTSMGSLAELEMEDDGSGASGDPTAATDRSVERRPWLVPTQSSGTRLGLNEPDPSRQEEAVKPASGSLAELAPASGPLPTREIETPTVMKPPPAGQDTQAAVKPESPRVEAPKVEVSRQEPAKAEPVTPQPAAETKVAEAPAKSTSSVDDLLAMAKSEPAPAKVETPAVATQTPTPTSAPTPTPEKPAEPALAAATTPATGLSGLTMDEEPSGAAEKGAAESSMTVPPPTEAPDAMPSLLAPPESVPGAPRRFAELSDSAPTNASATGGRPRLNEPRVPPTAQAAIAAPPPRYATLSDFKGDKTPPAVSGSKVAVVIEGLGLSQAATEAAINRLPTNVTLAFSPYARDLKRWIDRAKAKGHEVLIEVPMEGKGFPAEDPGPLGLVTVLETKDNADRLELILKEAAGATGIFDGQGSKFRESEEHINAVFTTLKEKNLFYVQGRPGVRVGEATVPTATADVVVDERPFRAAVDARLDYVERLAKYQGSSVAVMSAKPVSYERLALWIEQLAAKGVNLTPVSGVLIQ